MKISSENHLAGRNCLVGLDELFKLRITDYLFELVLQAFLQILKSY
jgi:hypothetical protein